MSSRVLIDTNILIEILNGSTSPQQLPDAGDFVISAVSVAELFALAGTSPEEERRIDKLVTELEVVAVGLSIAKRAGLLARTRRRGLPDLLIAATAIELGLSLLTRNARDFKNLPGLVIAALW